MSIPAVNVLVATGRNSSIDSSMTSKIVPTSVGLKKADIRKNWRI